MPVSNKKKLLFWSIIGLAMIMTISVEIIGITNWSRPCLARTEKRIWGKCYRDFQVKPLTIGVAIGAPDEDYESLATYLSNTLRIPVVIDRNTKYEQIPNRIVQKDWDIAFTRSPLFSIIAEDNRYTGVGLMFPEVGAYYRAALYVRKDSEIQSIDDLNSTTTIALGNAESAPTFHLPIYALYGKSLRVGIGYRPSEAIKLVKAGKIDVGAGRYDAVKEDPDLRIIYVSKAIPSAGVYLSPSLANSENRIRDALINAPSDIRAKAKYSDLKIPNYDQLRQIVARTESILGCPGFNINAFNLNKPVNLFCRQTQSSNIIQGQITEYKVVTSGNIEFKVVTPSNQIYLVFVSRQILNQIPINPVDTIDKFVQLKNIKPQQLANRTWSVEINSPQQISLVNDLSID